MASYLSRSNNPPMQVIEAMFRSADSAIQDNMTFKYLEDAAIACFWFSDGRIRK